MKYLVLILLLAGCTQTVDSPEPEPDTAMMMGYVIDTTLRPIADANLTVNGSHLNATTDAGGYYELNGIPIDEPLVFVARAEGYLPVSKSISHSGVSILVNFTLSAAPVQNVRTETVGYTFFYECTSRVGVGNETYGTECGGRDNVTEFSVEPGLMGAVFELFWEPSTDTGSAAYMRAETAGYGDLDRVLFEVAGEPDLQGRMTQDDGIKFYSDGGRVKVTIGPYANEDALEGVGSTVFVQQELELIVTLFYYQPAPANFTSTV